MRGGRGRRRRRRRISIEQSVKGEWKGKGKEEEEMQVGADIVTIKYVGRIGGIGMRVRGGGVCVGGRRTNRPTNSQRGLINVGNSGT